MKPKVKPMTAQWFVQESLKYERGVSIINALIRDIYAQRADDKAQSKRNGVEPDGAFSIVMEVLEKERKDLQSAADVMWKQAESRCSVFDYAVEDLLNAVLIRAATDYESVLCGYGDDTKKAEIEHFFDNDAELLTDADVSWVLPRIKSAQRKFTELVRCKKDTIITETREKRRNGSDMRSNSVKCPLCGSGLYEYGSGVGGRHLIRCTGCNLSEMVTCD